MRGYNHSRSMPSLFRFLAYDRLLTSAVQCSLPELRGFALLSCDSALCTIGYLDPFSYVSIRLHLIVVSAIPCASRYYPVAGSTALR
ncbi:hypothetical protein QQF64_026236 [Cirrhinus molitorella]|uniref:Uncharacterized protein n=1 Tax=Cirrhinus molitorella TaxID=172907 RepID=A0ABR3NSB3_9TELE